MPFLFLNSFVAVKIEMKTTKMNVFVAFASLYISNFQRASRGSYHWWSVRARGIILDVTGSVDQHVSAIRARGVISFGLMDSFNVPVLARGRQPEG